MTIEKTIVREQEGNQYECIVMREEKRNYGAADREKKGNREDGHVPTGLSGTSHGRVFLEEAMHNDQMAMK